jgi:hypothetical protein
MALMLITFAKLGSEGRKTAMRTEMALWLQDCAEDKEEDSVPGRE